MYTIVIFITLATLFCPSNCSIKSKFDFCNNEVSKIYWDQLNPCEKIPEQNK